MKTTPRVLPALNAIPIFLALASCSSPPKPPTVDESTRRPANVAAAVDLQACRSDLQNTRIFATENARAAQASGSTVARLIQQQAMAQTAAASNGPAGGPSSGASGNTIRIVRFAFGSSQFSVSDAESKQLIDQSRGAPLIVLRGRTDGNADSSADSRIARLRAEAVKSFLVRGGVEPARIRMTWQPYGDTVADNNEPSGRALNRRVEIEIYRTAPQVATAIGTGQG